MAAMLSGAGGGMQLSYAGVGAYAKAAGISAGTASALVEALGLLGAGAAIAFMDVSGIGHDADKFVEALTGGESKAGKNGTYEKADYHSGQATGRKNPAPKDGQFALDNSAPIGENTSRRIDLDSNGDFVVLDETTPGTFHGHIREWSSNGNQGLTQEMKNALYKAGYIKSPTASSFKLTNSAKKLIGK